MARVDYQGSPETQASPEAPEDYQHIETSPATFGGAVAEGSQALGQGLMDASKFYSQVSADQATNNLIESATNILHGQPGKTVVGPDGQPGPDTGFLGLRGQNAMDAYTDASSSLDEAIKEQASGLKTPQARLQFDTESRRYRSQWMAQMGSHVDDQQKTWATDQNNTTATLGLNAVSRVAADDAASAIAGERVRQGYVKNAQLAGLDVNGALLKADQQIALTRIDTLAANPATAKDAQRVYDQSADVIGSLPNYGAIGRQVKGAVIDATMAPAVDKAVGEALAGAQGAVGPTMDVTAAIGKQEWRGKGVAPTSVDGAVGNSQILPATAQRYGLDPSKLGDPAYAEHARQTIISKISALPNVQGDPARIAVAYFSGEGNVAPPGSPTPWKHDAHDGNGKSVSSYVADVTSRVSAYPSTADALNANMANIETKAQGDAEKLFPGYPDAQDQYVQRVLRGVNRTVAQQTRQYEVDAHVVQAAMAGDNPPISEEELKAKGPQVAAAWASLQFNNPTAAISARNAWAANSRGISVGNGAQFKDYLDRALAPATDPNRLNNPTQLWPFVGPGETAPLTNTGANALTDLMGLRGTPQGEANAAQIKSFVDQAHAQLTYSNAAAGITDAKGEAAFGKFMSATLPVVVKAAKAGNLGAVLDPKSPDFVGKSAGMFSRTPAQIVADRLHSEGVSWTPGMGETPKTIEGLHMMVSTGKLKPDEAAWIANRLGLQKSGGAPASATPQKPAAPANRSVGGYAESPLPGIPMMGVPAH